MNTKTRSIILERVPKIIRFASMNLLVFTTSNLVSEESVTKDVLNVSFE